MPDFFGGRHVDEPLVPSQADHRVARIAGAELFLAEELPDILAEQARNCGRSRPERRGA